MRQAASCGTRCGREPLDVAKQCLGVRERRVELGVICRVGGTEAGEVAALELFDDALRELWLHTDRVELLSQFVAGVTGDRLTEFELEQSAERRIELAVKTCIVAALRRLDSGNRA